MQTTSVDLEGGKRADQIVRLRLRGNDLPRRSSCVLRTVTMTTVFADDWQNKLIISLGAIEAVHIKTIIFFLDIKMLIFLFRFSI